MKNKISRQWQYYIWLVVILRLLLPFGLETNLMGKTYQAVERAIIRTTSLPGRYFPSNEPKNIIISISNSGSELKNAEHPTDDAQAVLPLQAAASLQIHPVWLVWLAVALGILIRKITIYRSFLRYVNAGLLPVSDTEILDRLSVVTKWAGIKQPVDLCVNPLVFSPMLIGFFHPCIVLPGAELSEKDFAHTVLHELIHYKRKDAFYKWLVQVVVCLHWFNPFVHVMEREITKACEFSCDEAVLTKIGYAGARDYGKTLLNAMAAIRTYREHPGTVTLSENKQLLKERLGAIMNFKGTSKTMRLLTGVLTLCMIWGTALIGVYPVAASGKSPAAVSQNSTQTGKDYVSKAKQYYKAGSLSLFELTFPKLDKKTQKTWMKKFYADGDAAFFSVAVRGLDTKSSLFSFFVKKAYADDKIAFFSILSDRMSEAELELWLDRALEDGKWAFESVLSDRPGKDEKDKKWDAAQEAEYKAAGVTMDGTDYYYKKKLVNIFLDMRTNKSFYTLHINPAGTVNIKIIRDAKDRIKSVAYMTETEVAKLLEDMK